MPVKSRIRTQVLGLVPCQAAKPKDRYKKICPSLLKLDGGCVRLPNSYVLFAAAVSCDLTTNTWTLSYQAHDLAMEETNLPHGSYVRLVCEDCLKLNWWVIAGKLGSAMVP